MPFFQVKETNYTVKIFCVFFTVLIFAGCAAQGPQSPKTAEQAQPSAGLTDEPAAPVESSRQINDVIVNQMGQALEVNIAGNEKLVYTSIKQSFPFGIAIYLPETKISPELTTPSAGYNGISDLVVGYADKEETTAKIEILLTQDLNYEVQEGENNLKVYLSGIQGGPVAAVSQDAEPKAASTMSSPSAPEPVSASKSSAVVPDKTATMSHIEFNTMEDGKSDIVVQTTHPVNYDISQGENGKLYLNLYNTKIPYYHKRALLTEYFKSAVESLMPMQVPGKKTDARIEIQMRDTVPYRIVQDQNTLSMFFEPSRVEPPVFTKSRKQVVSGEEIQVASMAGPETVRKPLDTPETKTQKRDTLQEDPLLGGPKEYTGEKIKLDFYETDIKNVLRILRSVGGLNFAIDKDVTGKVTLSLDDPVPWDQVLDLVLRMNNLGQKREGNVIRIAKLETLKKEEKLIQEAIDARKKSLAQQKSLAPLVTEYIPINYSDAEADIKPHIEQLLTPNRGKISVDGRTNMIILTDTQEKIDQAAEVIYRLDRVTPQIMIEAKVVEVTKDFSRELGIGLSLTQSQDAYTQNRDTDFTVALNSPIAAPSNTGSFNFYRVFGSDYLSLNAQIAASETKGDVKIVSSPRILTLDNKGAKIKQGLEYPYLERDDTGGSSVKFKSIDLLLEVTPHVTPDQRIAMTVFLTKNDIDSITNGVPSLSTNEATTELLVNDKDTIIIGGIVKTTETDSSSGTPYLAGIPLLGRLFRTDLDSNRRNELLIFITPSIVQLEQKRNTFTSSPAASSVN